MDVTEAIDQYSLCTYGHTDWGWIYNVDKEELESRDHIRESYVVFFTEPEEDDE